MYRRNSRWLRVEWMVWLGRMLLVMRYIIRFRCIIIGPTTHAINDVDDTRSFKPVRRTIRRWPKFYFWRIPCKDTRAERWGSKCPILEILGNLWKKCFWLILTGFIGRKFLKTFFPRISRLTLYWTLSTPGWMEESSQGIETLCNRQSTEVQPVRGQILWQFDLAINT